METLGFQIALRERSRLLLTAGGIAGALVLTIFVIGVYRGAVLGSLRYVEETGADVWVAPRGSWNLLRTSGFLPRGALEVVGETPGVARAEGIAAALLPADLAGQPRTLLVIGIDPGSRIASPRALLRGRGIEAPGEAVIDAAFARRAHLGIGDSVALAGRPQRIVGVSRGTNLLVTQYAFVSVCELRAMLGLNEQHSFLLVEAERGRDPAALAESLEASHPSLAAFDAERFLENNRKETARGFLPVLWAIAVLGGAVGAAVVGLMSTTAVLEKRADYALLAALGAPASTRIAVVLGHALASAVCGAALGLACLAAIGWILPRWIPEVELRLGAGVTALAVAGAIATAALGAALPAHRVSRIDPMEAFRR